MRPLVRSTCALFPVLLAAALAGCGPTHGGTIDAGPEVDAGPGDGGGGSGTTLRLAFIGSATQTVQAGSQTQLKVMLVQDEVGPVVGRAIQFSIPPGLNPAGSTLDGGLSAAPVTDATGVAFVTLAAGSDETTFQVVASTEGANQVATGIRVIRIQQMIEIKRTPGIVIESSGIDARAEIEASTKVQLRVQITDQFGSPLSGVPVTFGFDGPQGAATLEDGGTPPITGAGGEASITCDTGGTAPASFRVTARGDRSPTVTWQFSVAEGQSTGRTCQLDSDCAEGQVCRGGLCDSAGGACTVPSDCPTGYGCIGNECTYIGVVGCADDSACGEGFHCGPDGECIADEPDCIEMSDCPDGFECNGGICEPRGDIFPDVSGGWYTAHVFEVGEALGTFGNITGQVLRRLDQILQGQIDLPGWVPGFIEDAINSIVSDYVDDYVPEWVQDLVSILDSLMTVLSEMRARGYMEITQEANSPTFTATEMWDSFVFYYLPLCGGVIPSDPTPDCARFDMFTDYLSDDYTIGLRVHPFTGKVGPYAAGGPNNVLIDKRKIEMNFAKLVAAVVDQLVGMFTPYDTIAEALPHLIDCVSIGQSISDLASGWVDASTAEGWCDSAVQMAGAEITNQLTAITFDLGILEFNGQATMTLDTSYDPPYCDEMGYVDYDERTPSDGQWTGKFSKVVKNVPGAWTADRSPLP